ncbi:MAG: hypothetical protein LLG01_09775 [Planctomycetaceae bacterium]|nr:hypothetical protein [Planctomycetaceae bacterium]
MGKLALLQGGTAARTLAITAGMGHRVTGNVTILGRIYDFFDKHLKVK